MEEEGNEQKGQDGQEKLNENNADADDIDDRAISTPIKNILSSNVRFLILPENAVFFTSCGIIWCSRENKIIEE